ncbi:MAG: hypothetical protein A3B82_01370 [Methylophilales bacterium RIFCSPHIGHO2_02_FULL_57_10]|nr:MAG: hypothetical protein A3B82_01370 [Methylophilales bacterium RIFCSPHIGHO2_02_FULL_57_10]
MHDISNFDRPGMQPAPGKRVEMGNSQELLWVKGYPCRLSMSWLNLMFHENHDPHFMIVLTLR